MKRANPKPQEAKSQKDMPKAVIYARYSSHGQTEQSIGEVHEGVFNIAIHAKAPIVVTTLIPI